MGYALPVKTRYEMTEHVKDNEVLDCPNHRDKICILKRLKKIKTLVYLLPGAELNQMLTLVVAIKSEMPCEPELLLFAGMNFHLHAAGLLEHLKGDALTTKKFWEAIQTLFAAMDEVQESVFSRFGSKTRVAFTTSTGYASKPPALQFVYAILILIAEVVRGGY